MSYIEFDINKDTTDILGLFRYLSAKVQQYNQQRYSLYPDIQTFVPQPSPPGALGSVLDYFGQNMAAIDPQQMMDYLGPNGQLPVLGYDEIVSFFVKLILCQRYDGLIFLCCTGADGFQVWP